MATVDPTWYSWTSSTTSSTTNFYTYRIWTTWNTTATTSTTNNTTGDSWYVWNTQPTKTVQLDDGTTWEHWSSIQAWEETTKYKESRRQRSKRIRQATAVSRRNEKHRRKALARAEIARRERQAADQKSKDLLLDIIGEEQFKVYEKTGRLIVKGRKHDYLIHARGGGVMRIEKNKLVDLCVHFNDRDLPLEDKVVGFALAIKADDTEFKRIANDQDWKVNEFNPKKLPEAANF